MKATGPELGRYRIAEIGSIGARLAREDLDAAGMAGDAAYLRRQKPGTRVILIEDGDPVRCIGILR